MKLVAASEDAFKGVKGKVNSLINVLRANLKKLLLQEAVAGSEEAKEESRGTSLSTELVKQCVANFVHSTEDSDTVKSKSEESLHPYFSPSNYKGEIRFKGAKALRVTFDPRCCTEENTGALIFFSDKECDTRIIRFAGESSNFKPFIVHADRVFYKVPAQEYSPIDLKCIIV